MVSSVYFCILYGVNPCLKQDFYIFANGYCKIKAEYPDQLELKNQRSTLHPLVSLLLLG